MCLTCFFKTLQNYVLQLSNDDCNRQFCALSTASPIFRAQRSLSLIRELREGVTSHFWCVQMTRPLPLHSFDPLCFATQGVNDSMCYVSATQLGLSVWRGHGPRFMERVISPIPLSEINYESQGKGIEEVYNTET